VVQVKLVPFRRVSERGLFAPLFLSVFCYANTRNNEGDGADIFKAACELGHEGIVAKRKDLAYESGRSKRWLKIKNPKSLAAKRIEDGAF
jgi:hypothetical protein